VLTVGVIAIYAEDCDCDAAGTIGVTGLVVQRFKSEAAACSAFAAGVARWVDSIENERPMVARYFCIHGPGGHVIGLRSVSS
jgi:hypothetical protein